MTREWLKPDRRIGISLDVDGLTWWYAERMAMSIGTRLVWSDSGHVFGDWGRFWAAVRMYRKGAR